MGKRLSHRKSTAFPVGDSTLETLTEYLNAIEEWERQQEQRNRSRRRNGRTSPAERDAGIVASLLGDDETPGQAAFPVEPT